MNKTLRNALIAAAAVVTVVLILPFVVPVDTYRTRIESAAEHATGRTLRIEGPLRLMLFPQFGLRAEQVTFANMPGGRAAAMARVGDIKLAIHLWPLLAGRVEVSQIVLDRPDIELEVDARGQSNWAFAKSKGASGGSSVTLPLDTRFDGIKISDGHIAYSNARTGTRRAADHVNAMIGITRLDRPVSIDGNLAIGDHRVDFEGRVVTVKALLGDEPALLDVSLTSDMMQASFKGTLTQDGLDGAIKFDTASVRNVAQWLGEKLPSGGGLGPLSLEGRLAKKDKVTVLDPIRLSLDHANMRGKVSIDARGNVPSVTGALWIDHLDLNPYLQTSGSPSQSMLRNPEPGWSREPINLAWLKEADSNLSVDIGLLRLRGLRLGHTVGNVIMTGGALTARLDSISLYGGTGRAEFDVSASGTAAVIGNKLQFDHIALQPFLNDTLGLDRIEGTGSLSLDIASQGASANAVMHALSGKGSIGAGQGRIRGVDLRAVARTIQIVIGSGATGEVASTDFHDMGGNFVIAHGVLTNKDFHLSGPLLSMTGAGDIDIGNRSLDFRVVPKAGVGGQHGPGIGIPFHIKGSWDHVHYAPDLSGVMKGVMQNLENGKAPFKGLFGGSNKPQDQGGVKKKKKSTGDVLKNMLGIH